MSEYKDTIIEFKNVSVGYSKKSNIVNNFSTKIKRGDFVSIIGPNGSGKSTILKSIFKLVDVNSGEITYEDKNVSEYKSKELARKISFVPQITNFPSDVTLYEFVMMGRFPHGNIFTSNKEKDKKIVLDAIKSVGLSGLENDYVNNLSGGQQQRSLIALVLAQDTETIILDEPTNHLDIRMQLEIMNILHELNHTTGKTIIVVVHDINHGLKFSDNVIVMKEGNKIIEGKTNDIIVESLIKDVFNVNPEIIMSGNKKIICDYWIDDLDKNIK